MAVPNAFMPLTVCFRRTSSSARKARLSQTNTRLPAANPSGKLLSTELRTPTESPTPGARGVCRSQHAEEPRVGPGQPVLFRLDDVPGAAERLRDGVEHPGVADGVPPALGRGRVAGVQLVERDEPAAGVEHEIGHDTYPLM